VAYQLGFSRLYRDRSLNQLLAIYNPDPSYAAKVKSVMRQIAVLQ
jgi:flagellum-specific peptidoglycan hydrolase FlgJ